MGFCIFYNLPLRPASISRRDLHSCKIAGMTAPSREDYAHLTVQLLRRRRRWCSAEQARQASRREGMQAGPRSTCSADVPAQRWPRCVASIPHLTRLSQAGARRAYDASRVSPETREEKAHVLRGVFTVLSFTGTRVTSLTPTERECCSADLDVERESQQRSRVERATLHRAPRSGKTFDRKTRPVRCW